MSAEAEKKDAFDLAIEHMWKQYRKDFDVPAAGYRIEDFSAGYEAGFSAGREHERKRSEGLVEALRECSLPQYPDSNPLSLIETLNARARAALAEYGKATSGDASS